jgi:phosphoribosylformylglycinamidine synthase
MDAVRSHAARGGLVLGICNGFQILCEAGLLPGALRANASLSFVCRDVSVDVVRRDTAFTSVCPPQEPLTLPVKHGEGCFYAPADLADEQIVFRYASGDNPNGAERDIAGVVSADGNVLGLMPHPEHAVDPLLGSTDGALVLGSLVAAARERALAAAA